MDSKYEKFIKILSIFKNKPNYLAKFLIKNLAINDSFINKLNENNINIDTENLKIDFNSISEMDNYYSSLIEFDNDLNKEESEKYFNEKLKIAIEEERYEDAAYIRDFMKKEGIKKINKNK